MYWLLGFARLDSFRTANLSVCAVQSLEVEWAQVQFELDRVRAINNACWVGKCVFLPSFVPLRAVLMETDYLSARLWCRRWRTGGALRSIVQPRPASTLSTAKRRRVGSAKLGLRLANFRFFFPRVCLERCRAASVGDFEKCCFSSAWPISSVVCAGNGLAMGSVSPGRVPFPLCLCDCPGKIIMERAAYQVLLSLSLSLSLLSLLSLSPFPSLSLSLSSFPLSSFPLSLSFSLFNCPPSLSMLLRLFFTPGLCHLSLSLTLSLSLSFLSVQFLLILVRVPFRFSLSLFLCSAW